MGDLSLPPNKKISAHSLTEDMCLVLVHRGFHGRPKSPINTVHSQCSVTRTNAPSGSHSMTTLVGSLQFALRADFWMKQEHFAAAIDTFLTIFRVCNMPRWRRHRVTDCEASPRVPTSTVSNVTDHPPFWALIRGINVL